MLRVCGVTFDHTTNYGTCFQSYALQHVIEQQYIDGIQCAYDLLPVSTFPYKTSKSSKRSLLTKAKRLVIKVFTKYRRKQFEDFELQHMHYADCHSREELLKLNDQYDAFVCGSDVIWNFAFVADNPTYFLDFAQKYKFSYAASFGRVNVFHEHAGEHIPEGCEAIVREHLPRLNRISVRERDGKRIAGLYTSKEVTHVCDPVLLLEDSQWNTLLPPSGGKTPYIFAYHTLRTPLFSSFLNEFKKQTNLPLKHIAWKTDDALKQRILSSPKPLKWLAMLRDAEYVVTNSFHGTLFAILFHKKFFSVVQGDRSVRSNIRLYELLENMGLGSRLYSSVPKTIDLNAVDFTEADQKIAAFRAKSLTYLRENLEAAYAEKIKLENKES